MTSIDEMISLVSSIKEDRIENLARYVEANDPASISFLDLERLGFMPSESDRISSIMKNAKDGGLLALSMRLASRITVSERKEELQLVMSGNFQEADAAYTHEMIYNMIGRAKYSITIVGYWMYNIADLIKTISDLQEEKGLKVRFILNSAKKWKKQILNTWNEKYRPEIFEVNTNNVKTLHAKIIIIDNSEILVTSANLTMNAMEENIEAGIWTSNKDIIKSCYSVLDEFEKKHMIFRSKRGIC